MYKREFLFGFSLFFISVTFLFSQNVERITYMDLGPDGSRRVTRTVDAIHIGWEQHQCLMEGNLRVVYSTFRLIDGEWSDWMLVQRDPWRHTLRQTYDFLVRDYVLFPNAGSIIKYSFGNVLRMNDIPNGSTSPFWWSQDGRSFFIFYKLYATLD